jgi:hypothetical protein
MDNNIKMSKFSVHADGQGIARQYDERLSEATGVIDKYIQDGNVDRPHFEHSVESLAQGAIDRGAKREYDELEWRARELLKARCTNEDTMYPCLEKVSKAGKTWYDSDPVVLDLDGMADQLKRNWGLPIPAIYFAMLDPERDRLYGPECKAVAVYFNPQVNERTGQSDASKLTQPRTITWDGKQVTIASDWDPACYDGVVRTFDSFTSMRQAHAELKAAVKAIQEDVPTDAEPDVFDDPEYLASIEATAEDINVL